MSYLNAKPLLYGIKRHPVFNEMDLLEDYPSRIARMLIDDEIDSGLIPVAATLELSDWHIVGDYCIGSEGAVASVCIFSDVPMEKIEKVYLDYQSRTSVNLAKILLREYWFKDVEFIDATGEDFRNEIRGTSAGVVIGDRALEQSLRSSYIYDLAAAWKDHTGLPFVFAAWIANKKIPPEFEIKFNDANRIGLDQIQEVINENHYPIYDLHKYYSECVSYKLDDLKRKGLELFLKKLKSGI